jgi:hypothetical protein
MANSPSVSVVDHRRGEEWLTSNHALLLAYGAFAKKSDMAGFQYCGLQVEKGYKNFPSF